MNSGNAGDTGAGSAGPAFVIVMGVSGSGKSTVGARLAQQLGWPFYDGDHFHPPANVAKMAAGIPLSDVDRAGWLETLATLIRSNLAVGQSGVLACSALRRSYRAHLQVEPQRVHFVFLKGPYDLIWERMTRRQDHYMQPLLLQSQFAALEEPDAALVLDIRLEPERLVERIVAYLAASPAQTDLQE